MCNTVYDKYTRLYITNELDRISQTCKHILIEYINRRYKKNIYAFYLLETILFIFITVYLYLIILFIGG